MEVGDEVQITAVVEDEETKVEDLTFEWTADRFPRSGAAVVEDFTPGHEASSLALVGVRRSLVSAGTFTGTGPRVRWRPPKGEPTPATYQLKLTVVERYTVTLPGGTETRENRASATVGVDVNDSPNDVADLVLAFLKDFSDSSVPAKICVRYFSEFCPRGRAEELEDIQENRDRYVILSSRHRIDRLTINETFDVADIKVSCEFTSRVIRTGRTEVSRGDCLFMAVYGPRRWGLCESHFQ